jgi:hypothetical protein
MTAAIMKNRMAPCCPKKLPPSTTSSAVRPAISRKTRIDSM